LEPAGVGNFPHRSGVRPRQASGKGGQGGYLIHVQAL